MGELTRLSAIGGATNYRPDTRRTVCHYADAQAATDAANKRADEQQQAVNKIAAENTQIWLVVAEWQQKFLAAEAECAAAVAIIRDAILTYENTQNGDEVMESLSSRVPPPGAGAALLDRLAKAEAEFERTVLNLGKSEVERNELKTQRDHAIKTLSDTSYKLGLTEFERDDARAKLVAANNAVKVLGLIDALRADEGASVTIMYPNPNFGGPNEIVYTCNSLTDSQDQRFEGDTLLAALEAATAAREAGK